MNNNVNELINKFNNLDISKQRIILDLVNNLSTEENQPRSKRQTARTDRIENINFRSNTGIPLAISDRVRILNSRKTGKSGDTAIVVKFNKLYVAVKLEKNGSVTQRSSKNLQLIN